MVMALQRREQSTAWGCAKAFREPGAELAVTWFNDMARPHVDAGVDIQG